MLCWCCCYPIVVDTAAAAGAICGIVTAVVIAPATAAATFSRSHLSEPSEQVQLCRQFESNHSHSSRLQHRVVTSTNRRISLKPLVVRVVDLDVDSDHWRRLSRVSRPAVSSASVKFERHVALEAIVLFRSTSVVQGLKGSSSTRRSFRRDKYR